LYTSPNFGDGSRKAFAHVQDFLASSTTQIHCIWYCVASDPSREIDPLEGEFLESLGGASQRPPAILVFTKYDEFVSETQLQWARDAGERGLSKVAVSHILGDLTVKRFEEKIGKRWDAVLAGAGPVQRVCVASEDAGSFERLAATTSAVVRDEEGRRAFATAQRNNAAVSTRG
jgi:hypothetical protein